METGLSIRRVLLECTRTHSTSLNTGIQRVVRNLCRNSPGAGAQLGVTCTPVICYAQKLFAVTCRPDRGFWGHTPARKPGTVGRWLHAAGDRLWKVFFPRTLYRHAASRVWQWLGWETLPECGDLLLLVDCVWWQRDLYPMVLRAKQRGAWMAVLVHDLIPLTHPQFHSVEFAANFRRWLDEMASLADFFMADSRTTRDTLREYLQHRHPGRDWKRVPFGVFRLGCSLDLIAAEGGVRDDLKPVFGGNGRQATYLTVGTIEPRKNHRLILDAFDHVWQTTPEARLCIVGKLGWMCDNIVRRIREHPRWGESLFMFNDLTDAELRYCYRNARALVFASQIEGFGLPIVEALRHRLRVMLSDTPIHREVGKDFCAYFDVRAPEALARLVLDLERQGRFPRVRRPEEFELPDWETSSREFLQRCLDAVRLLDRDREIERKRWAIEASHASPS